MPGIKIPKESLEGPKKIAPGIQTVRFDGFEPAKDQKGTGVNLNPILKIINNTDLHDRRIRDTMSSKAGWVILDFCHCLGVELGGTEDDPELPGNFYPEGEPDPSKWKYQGPLLGQTGQVELADVEGQGKNAGKTFSNIKRYLCAIPGCTKKHSESLLRTK